MSTTRTDHREARQVRQAIELIELGARLPLLEAELGLGRERLIALYEEVKGVPPAESTAVLPPGWFLPWQPNMHASLFIAIWRYLHQYLGVAGADALVQGYRLYTGHMQAAALTPVLTMMRAWTLIRYLGASLRTAPCAVCGTDFVVPRHDTGRDAACGLCRPPFNAAAQP